MIRVLLSLALLSVAPVQALAEDAAHRADRLRTIELNRRAESAVNRRDRGNADVRAANRRARERYEQELDRWRERVAACREGDDDACAR